MTELGRLSGQRVLVTGAAGGIGAAAITRLTQDGADIVPTDVVTTAGMRGCDITERNAVDAMMAAAGPLWGVVHAAALCGGSGSFETVASPDFARYVEVNLQGAFNVIQSAARAMIAGGKGGRIVVVGSVNALVAEPGAAPYAAAKGGLRMLARAAAVDLARHGIAVSLVHPGPIEVPRNADLFASPALREAFAARIPMGGPGTPEAVAAAISYLLDPAATYTTGAEIMVDGGATARF
ncbi:MAG: SDR family oxidoreductase [Rubellimicrobium sp.]|nr:SDR family oxidoreductase [Rubellimicrobium sp.]